MSCHLLSECSLPCGCNCNDTCVCYPLTTNTISVCLFLFIGSMVLLCCIMTGVKGESLERYLTVPLAFCGSNKARGALRDSPRMPWGYLAVIKLFLSPHPSLLIKSVSPPLPFGLDNRALVSSWLLLSNWLIRPKVLSVSAQGHASLGRHVIVFAGVNPPPGVYL